MTIQMGGSVEGLIFYHPKIEIWSGTVKVRRDVDLADAKQSLPPSMLVSDGRKRLVKTEPLRPLHNTRKRVDTLIRNVGFPFMGGLAVPESESGSVEDQLVGLEREFFTAVDELCSELDQHYSDLEREYPEWAEMLNRSRLSESEVRSRCRFDVIAFRASAPCASTSSQKVADRFGRFAKSALPDFLVDFGKKAESVLEGSFMGRDVVNQRQVLPVRELVAKLETFAFLDPRVGPMAQYLQEQLRLVPLSGRLNTVETALVASLLKTMCSPDFIVSQAGLMPVAGSVDTSSVFSTPALVLNQEPIDDLLSVAGVEALESSDEEIPDSSTIAVGQIDVSSPIVDEEVEDLDVPVVDIPNVRLPTFAIGF